MASKPAQNEVECDHSSTTSSSSATLNSSHSSVSDCSASFSCGAAGYCSARSSISCETNSSLSWSAATNKPHKANDAAWEAIRNLRSKDGGVGLNHFKLLQRLGSGDIGNVYLCQLVGDRSCEGGAAPVTVPGLYAMKVVDKAALAYRNKLQRAEMEKQILSALDHPFLPTLYAHFDASHYSCLVMEFCPGGDLHSLRQRQLLKRFNLKAARFYAAEVLVALEYLHMMGVVYRDLKPENVLVRQDGHIMLSDFDLSLKCDALPTLQTLPSTPEYVLRTPEAPTCSSIEPMISCFSTSHKTNRNPNSAVPQQQQKRLPELVAEPREVRSKSFVGTHEYLAPEIISGQGHGSAVDWYTLGIFLFELLYGRTPFRGASNETTLLNIVAQPLRFPEMIPMTTSKEAYAWEAARDLIKKLVTRDPRRRLGSNRGAAEIKRHPFFKGVNWALIRSLPPPEVPALHLRSLFSHKKKKSYQQQPLPPHFDYF